MSARAADRGRNPKRCVYARRPRFNRYGKVGAKRFPPLDDPAAGLKVEINELVSSYVRYLGRINRNIWSRDQFPSEALSLQSNPVLKCTQIAGRVHNVVAFLDAQVVVRHGQAHAAKTLHNTASHRWMAAVLPPCGYPHRACGVSLTCEHEVAKYLANRPCPLLQGGSRSQDGERPCVYCSI
jgi:hypothetical protein